MQEITLADTSCLILLEKLNLLHILQQLYGTIHITSKIQKEYGKDLPDFFTIKNPKNSILYEQLRKHLDAGEASAIAVAVENTNSLLIIDELKGREEAIRRNISVTGTIGVLILAIEKNLIVNSQDLMIEIENTNFRISKSLLDQLRKMTK